MENTFADFEFQVSPEATPDGQHFIRKAPILFKAGKYDKQEFEMTPDELKACCAEFKDPVELEDTHSDSYFNGHLGHVVAIEPTADFNQFGCTVKLKKWIHDVIGDKPLSLSARFDRKTKRLKKVALVPNPQIPEAVLFAAFSKMKTETDDPGARERSHPDSKAVADAKKTQASHTPSKNITAHGQRVLQKHHDLAAFHGARCEQDGDAKMSDFTFAEYNKALVAIGEKPLSVDEFADFMMAEESQSLKKIHAAAKEGGASCKVYQRKAEGEKPGVLNEYMMRDATAPFSQPDPEKERMREEIRTERNKRIEAEAVTFAKDLTRAGKIVRAQESTVAFAYAQAAKDDAEHGDVTFSDGTKFNRANSFKAMWANAEKHALFTEMVTTKELTSIHNADSSGMNKKPTQEELDKDLAKSSTGRTILRNREKAALEKTNGKA